MVEATENAFEPDYAVPPGETLEEELDARGMSQAELAERTGMARKTLNEIIKGKAPITPETALKFERVFALPARFWLNLERHYQETLARLAERQRLEADVSWLKRLPLKRMVEWGWIAKREDKAEQLDELLRFFGVASVAQWGTVWKGHAVAYRQSKVFQSHPEAVSAWLREGERRAAAIQTASYDAKAFRRVLTEIRALTLEEPGVFQPKMEALCAAAGVAVVFVPELPKSPVSGATRWLNKEKALVQLSLRYKSDDHLWFTFFHEAGHLLLHGKREVFIEGTNGLDEEKEAEANDFAARALVSPKTLDSLASLPRISKAAIRRAAEEEGIAPGIIVGQLQHRGELPFTHCNDLKRRFKWALPT